MCRKQYQKEQDMVIDMDLLEAVYEKYKDNIFAIGFNYFRNTIEADDVVQETFLKLARSGKDFESEEHLRNWLIRVAVNECRRVSLSSWVKKKAPLEEYTGQIEFETREESRVFAAVMNLPKKYRQVVHLFYFEDYPTAEIADMLGISRTAVTTRLQRSRERLKKELMEVWEDD